MAGGGCRPGPGAAWVTVSPANPSRVWALIEAEDGGVYRSDDAGATWKRNNERRLRQRACYTHIFADPKNADSMYVSTPATGRRTAGARSTRSACRTATTMTSGSHRTTRCA